MQWFVPLCHAWAAPSWRTQFPLLVSGMMGRPSQSPFAEPPDRGLSLPTVDALWGFGNPVVGYLLVCRVGSFDLRSDADAGALGAGALLMALLAARHFGRVQDFVMPERP